MITIMRNMLMLLTIAWASLSFAHAQEANGTTGEVRVNEVMMNTSHQFIYAFFGRDLLLYYLTDSEDIKVIEEAREADLIELSKPFNSTVNKLMMVGLTLVYGVVLGYFVVRLLLFLSEQGWLMQRDGHGNLSEAEQRGAIIKIVVLGGLAVIPIPMKNDFLEDTFYTNAATVLLFDLLGRANALSDESMNGLIESQRQTLTTMTLPAASAKASSGEALNAFYTCVRAQEQRDKAGAYTAQMPLYHVAGDSVSGQLSVGDCYLSVTFGLDTKSDQKIAKIMEASPSLGLNTSLFQQAQKSTFSTLLQEVFTQGVKNSAELSKPLYSSSWEDGQFSLMKHTSDMMSASELESWSSRCDEVNAWTSPLGDKVGRRDRLYFHLLSARCLSKSIAQSLVYPSGYQAMSAFLGESSAQPELALCVDQASMTSTLKNSRFAAEYGIGAARGNTIESISLDSCLSNLCSAANVQNGGMYACSNALDLYETRLRDARLQQRGTMMLGFYMFDLFLHHPPSPGAKHVFSKFDISYATEAPSESEVPGATPFMTVSVPIPEVSASLVSATETTLDLVVQPESMGMPTITPPLPSSGSLMTSVFGYSRLEACAKNPMQIHAGFVCGNLPQEFSRFGMTMLHNAAILKAAFLMGQTAGNLKKIRPKENGTVQGFATNTPMMIGVREFSLAGAALFMGNTDVVAATLDSVIGLRWAGTDEFGYLNTERMGLLLSSSIVASFAAIAYSGADTTLFTLINSALLLMLLIGIVFGFLFPLFPLVMVISAMIKYAYILFSTLATHGFKWVDAGFDRDSDLLNDKLDKVWADWLALMLKLPLTVIGVVLAWLMSNVVISHVLNRMNLMVSTNDGIQGIIDMFVVMIVSCVVLVIIYNTVLTIIESFYDFTVEWVLGSMHNNPFSSNTRAVGWQDSKEILQLMGRR